MKLQKNEIHPSWYSPIQTSIAQMETDYLQNLEKMPNWLPGRKNLFAAFQTPVESTRYVLLGESPYPRRESANGYAFWDAAVGDLWSETGLAKPVNRATSLRNFIKMLLLGDGLLQHDNLSQQAIAALNKQHLIQSNDELFNGLISQGFLLLNASLVLSDKPVRHDAKAWRPFLNALLTELSQLKPDIQLIIFGNIAKDVATLESSSCFRQFCCEHPYNISFITNPNVLDFFKPFKLLQKD